MAEEFSIKDGHFMLNKQDPAKKKSTNSPDFFGTAKVDGVEYQLSGWGRLSKAGNPMVTGYIALPKEREQATPEQINSFMDTGQSPLDSDAPIERHEFDKPPMPDMDPLPF